MSTTMATDLFSKFPVPRNRTMHMSYKYLNKAYICTTIKIIIIKIIKKNENSKCYFLYFDKSIIESLI